MAERIWHGKRIKISMTPMDELVNFMSSNSEQSSDVVQMAISNFIAFLSIRLIEQGYVYVPNLGRFLVDGDDIIFTPAQYLIDSCDQFAKENRSLS